MLVYVCYIAKLCMDVKQIDNFAVSNILHHVDNGNFVKVKKRISAIYSSSFGF